MKERVLTVSNAYFIVWYLGSIDSVSRVSCECFFYGYRITVITLGFDPGNIGSIPITHAIL